MIATAGSLCALAAIVALSRGHVRDDHVLHPENDSMSSSNTNGTGKTSNIQIAELYDPQKRIMARKNEMTGECILKLMDDHAENSNVQNNYDSKMELSGDEMIEIIGENINDFCGNNVIVLKNFDDDGQLNRSKRSTDKKRYQGQTQTQFVSFGSKDSNQQTKNGLAEAVSQPDLSRATVNGLNGMGQAQSQSSFGDCDECTEQNYRTHPTYMGNSYPSTYPSSEINNNAPSKQGLSYGTGPSVSGQYPNIYPGPGINNIVPGKQDQGFGTGLPVNGQHTNIYPGSEMNNIVPGKPDQGFGTGIPANGQHPNIYPGSGINNIVPGKPDQGFGTGLPANGQHPNIYPGSGINNIVPGKPEQGFGTGPPVNGQHPNVYPDSGINNMVPSKQDQKYGIGSTVDRQYPGIYPGSEINNRLSDKQNQGGNNYLNNQYSHTQSDLGNHKVPGKLYQGYEQNPMPFNTNSHELKKPENTGEINQNMYSSSSGPVNPSVPYYQDKLTNNLSNQQMYPDGSGFPSFPSGSAQGILAPHNIPNNFDLTNPSTNTIIPVTTSVEYQNRPTNYLPSQLINYPHPVSTGLNQITPGKPTSGVSNSLNLQKNVNEAIGSSSIMQNGYPFLWNTQGNHGFTQLNLPSLCNYLYQSCLNALSNNNKLNEFQKTPGLQNTERNSNNGKQYERIVPSSEQPASYPLYGERINPNIVQPSFRQPQSSLGAGGSSIQQPVYIPFGGNINQNQIQPGYGQPQGSLNIVEPGVQQLGYIPSGGGMSPNQIQSGYGQPHGSLGTGGPGVQQSGYTQSGGNLNPNQAQISYGQPQGSLSAGGSGVQQPGYISSGGSTSPNQIQSGYGQPQGSLSAGGSGVQQHGYISSGGSTSPNQIQSGYGQPQGSLSAGGSGVQQPGYISSGGSTSPNQIQSGDGQPQSSLSAGGSGVQQPGYISSGGSTSPNQIQSGYGQPQGSLSAGGSGVPQPGYISSGGSTSPNQIQSGYGQPQGSLSAGGSGVQQPGYISSGGSTSPNQIQSGYGQPQGSLSAGGSGVPQPGYISSGGSTSPNQIQSGYGQPQGSLSAGGSGVQQPGYISSGGSTSPNQIQSSYGQPQGSLGAGGGHGVQQSGYTQSGGNVNPNQAQLSYGQPQGSLSTGGSGGSTSPNQIQSGYGQPQGSLGTGGPGVQKPGYTQSGDVYPNGPSSLQPALDGRNTPGNYPGSYGDNNYRGQQSGPGFQTGNNYLTSSPITGGQFGTDVSSGGSVTPVDTEGGDAQSMTNVNVDGKETSASASAQGKSKFGMTQTQVSGTYSGTGAFTAQAQTSDSDKGAQSRIVSNANGTTSAAQGRGGKGQAQSQVLYNAESGMAAGGSQSSGIDYGTNAQLQAGVKGGVADAQSTGPGSTSSQAQIGFLPHESNNDTDQESLFKGGGAASSQGGSRDGQSQSQLFGSYKHGISYNGAAQASSGKRLQNLPRLDLDGARPRTGRRDDASDNETRVKTVASATPAGTADDHADRRDVPSKRAQPPSVSPAADEQPDDNESEYDDYEDEDAMNTKSARVPGEAAAAAAEAPGIGQVQNIVVNVDGEHDAHVTRDEDGRLTAGQVLDAGQTVPGTDGARIPDGFRGRVVSVAGDRTGAAAVPGGRAQTQTVLLTPGAGGLTVVDKTRLAAMLAEESYVGPAGGGSGRGRFRADADGQTGEYRPGDRDVQYFTKSSTCGYFSFSCNYVDGAKSGRKICKPNQPRYPCQRTDRMV